LGRQRAARQRYGPPVPTYAACLIDVYETVLSVDFVRHTSSLAELAGVDANSFRAAVGPWGRAVTDGSTSIRCTLKQVLPGLGCDVDDDRLDQLVDADRQLLQDLVVLHEDTEPFLEAMRTKGVRTAFVSNCADNTRPLLTGLGLSALVDAVVLSCEVGAAKPDPRIYKIALDRLGVDAHEALLVDDQQRFCDGAKTVGMHAVLLDRVGDAGHIAGLADLAAHF
jgi:putative hydrolase of the HAD superfamily